MKEYFIKVGKERIPVGQKVYEEYYKSKERMKYLRKVERDIVISYDQALNDNLPVEALMSDRQELVADIVLNHLLVEELKNCIEKLEEDERTLINLLFFDQISERELETISGVSRSTIQSRKYRALEKLKKLVKL